jgi:hypothetical protein
MEEAPDQVILKLVEFSIDKVATCRLVDTWVCQYRGERRLCANVTNGGKNDLPRNGSTG